MTLATVICCTFAAVALIPLLRSTKPVHAASVEQADPTGLAPAPQQETVAKAEPMELDMFEAIPLESDPFAEGTSNEQTEVTFEQNHQRPTQVVSHSAPAEETTTIEPSTDSHSYEIPTERSLYVPVTVHPVTVNVDGTVFADEVSRLASSVDEMLQVQRTAIAQQATARENASNDQAVQTQLRERDSQLAQIDSSLKRLTESVETLRAESRRADAELSGKLHRDESSTHLIREFRQTLNEHRRLLERSAHQVAHTSRNQFDSVEQPFRTSGLPEPQPVAAPVGIPTDPLTVPTIPQGEPLHVPAMSTDPSQTQIVFPPTTAHGAWSRQAIVTDSCAESDFQISSQVINKQQVVANTDSAASQAVANGLHAATEGTQGDSTLLPPPIIIPTAAETEARPTVFEQTVNFAMPPTTDPLSHTTNATVVTHTTKQQTSATKPPKQHHSKDSQIKSGPRWMPKLIYGLDFQRPQGRRKKTHGHVKPGRTSKRSTRPSSPRPSTARQRTTAQHSPHKQHAHVAAAAQPRVPNPAGVTVPDAYLQRNSTRHQHRRHWPHTRSRSRQSPQTMAAVAGNSVQALKQFGGRVRNQTAGFLAKLRPNPQRQMQPHMHPPHRSMQASRQPPVNHRTGSDIRHVGHTQAVR